MDELRNKEYIEMDYCFTEKRYETAEQKLNKYLGREEEQDLFQREDHDQVQKESYYERKIKRYTALSDKTNENLVAFTNKNPYRNAKKRASNAKDATAHLVKAKNLQEQLFREKEKLKSNPENADEIQQTIYDLEDKLLDERHDASQYEVKVKAANKEDELIKSEKVDLTYYVCRLKLMRDRGLAYTGKYKDILQKYKKAAEQIGKRTYDYRRYGYNTREKLEFDIQDREDEKEYIMGLTATLDMNKLIHAAKKLSKDKKFEKEDRKSLDYIVGDGIDLMSEEVIRDRITMMLFSLSKESDIGTFSKYAKEEPKDLVWDHKKELNEEQYNAYLMENVKDGSKQQCEEEYRKAAEFMTVRKAIESKQLNVETDKHYHQFVPKRTSPVINIPLQGWKLHIGARNMRDFYEIGKYLVPDLIKMRAKFKLVNMATYNDEKYAECYLQREVEGSKKKEANVIGKEFTIYPNEDFDINKLSEQSKAVLRKISTRAAKTDKALDDTRITTRFAGFVGTNFVNDKGDLMADVRGKYKVPSFVSEANSLSEISQFYCDIKKEYEKSKDLLHYLNQYMIGKKLPNDKNSLPLAIREMLGKDQMDILLEKINNLPKGTIFPEDSEIIYSKPPRYSDYGINKTYLNGKWYISYPVIYRDWINKLI